jgi:hypothetical protein
MPNMKTKGQRNLKLLGGQEKPMDRRPDGRPDKLIPVYPPYNFVVRGYKKEKKKKYFNSVYTCLFGFMSHQHS